LITATDYHDDWVGRNGIFDLAFNRLWGLFWVPDQLVRRMTASGASQPQITQAIADWHALEAQNGLWFTALPLAGSWGDTKIGSTDFTIRQLAPQVFTWYDHPTYDAYWQTVDVQEQFQNVVVPTLVSGGWYDLFAVGTIDGYIGMKALGGTPLARNGTMLVMDCCGHGYFSPLQPGQVTWGPNKTDATLTRRFIDRYTKGITNGIENEPRVQLSVMVPPYTGTAGDTFILKTADYPLPGTQYKQFYLRSGGN
jgi:putative CocE/NonD family hydrolase